jgi:Holliday junction resolvase RusA-like endonuclease
MTDASPTIRIPFGALVPDNRRLIPGRGRLISSARYRVALDAVHSIAKATWKRRELLAGPVRLEARFWLPDRRKRDISNFVKLLGDGLSGVVYFDDQQIEHETLIKCGLDRQQARVEITVMPYTGEG